MLAENYSNILWKSIALTSNIFTEIASTMMYREGVLYNFVFTEFPFKTVSGDVTAYHRISLKPDEVNHHPPKCSPTRSCVLLPRPTTSSEWKVLIFFNSISNICKSWCLNTHFFPNNSDLNGLRVKICFEIRRLRVNPCPGETAYKDRFSSQFTSK